MFATSMGPGGIVLAIVGSLAFVAGHKQATAALEALPVEMVEAATERTARVNRVAVIAIAGALAIYFGARQAGYGRVGLYACEAILLINSAVVGRYRIARLADLGPPAESARRHRSGNLIQVCGACVMFVGCGMYLLRP